MTCPDFVTYFVLNGLQDGEEGMLAIRCGGHPSDPVQKDGWYFLPLGEDDGIGPFKSKEACERAATKAIAEYRKAEEDDAMPS